MSGTSMAMIGGSLVTGLLGANAQSNAANTAAAAEQAANQQAMAAQQQLYTQGVGQQNTALNAGNTLAGNQQLQLSNLFSPYTQAGQAALPGLQQYAQGGLQAFGQQQNMSGANGDASQSAAINQFQNSPMFQQLNQQGINTIAQNASMNGNLRSGNAVAQEAQFSPALLNQLLQQQFTNLGSLSSLGSASQNTLAGLGQSSASNQGQLGTNVLGQQLNLGGQVAGNLASLSGANTQAVTGLLGQQGQIGATNALAQGQAQSNLFSGVGSSINRAALLNSGLFSNNGNNGNNNFASANPGSSQVTNFLPGVSGGIWGNS